MQVTIDIPYLKVSRGELYSALNLALVEFVDVSGRQSIIDLGCGTGSLTEHLLNSAPDARIWAIDPDPSMAATVRERLGARVGVIEAGGENFGTLFPPHSVDALFVANAVHLIPDLPGFFGAARRVLIDGGSIGFNTTFYDRGADVSQRGLALQLVREAHQFLRETQPEQTPAVGARSAATRPLSLELYRELLASNGFESLEVEERQYRFPFALITDFLITPVFASGALPGVPSQLAVEAMTAAVDRLKARSPAILESSFVRQWLYLSARKV